MIYGWHQDDVGCMHNYVYGCVCITCMYAYTHDHNLVIYITPGVTVIYHLYVIV